jgi:hypothetical protein
LIHSKRWVQGVYIKWVSDEEKRRRKTKWVYGEEGRKTKWVYEEEGRKTKWVSEEEKRNGYMEKKEGKRKWVYGEEGMGRDLFFLLLIAGMVSGF